MDRSLKWRTVALVGIVLYCVATLMPSFVSRDNLPRWFTSVFSKRINLGLDLQGGLHIVYSIDLDKAIDDRASEIKRDLESRMTEKHYDKTAVKTPADPLGAVFVLAESPAVATDVKSWVSKDYIESSEKEAIWLDSPAGSAPNTVCFKVSEDYAAGLKKAALTNAVSTIRERI